MNGAKFPRVFHWCPVKSATRKMKRPKLLVFSLADRLASLTASKWIMTRENEASKSLRNASDKAVIALNKLSQANWSYVTNLTTANAAIKRRDGQLDLCRFRWIAGPAPLNYRFDCSSIETLRRIIKRLANINDAISDKGDFNEFEEAIMRMEANYATRPQFRAITKPISRPARSPEITKVFGESRDDRWVQTTGLNGMTWRDRPVGRFLPKRQLSEQSGAGKS